MRKRICKWLAWVLCAAMVIAWAPVGARAATEPFDNNGGTGQENSPYQISTKEQLRSFGDYVSAGNDCAGMFIELTQDIDLESEEWTPIGRNYEPYFNGVFDGKGHTVSGLLVTKASDFIPAGLFKNLAGTIKNLGVSGSVTGNNTVGGIVGNNTGTVENCHFTGAVSSVYGGLADVGGIVGKNSGTIRNCYNSGAVNFQNARIGGIAGVNQDGAIENCYNTGAVVGNRAGGIVGYNSGWDEISSVKSCYNTGKISGGTTGGISGSNSSDDSIIENCYYLEGTAGNGTSDGDGAGAVAKSAAEFRTLASLLNNGGSGNTWVNDTLLGRPVLEDNKETYTATEDHPFEIPDKTTLENFRNYVNAGNNCKDMFFKLTNNIDLGGEGNEWTPIGNDDRLRFQGTFDGDDHTISGLNITSGNNQGLFGVIDNSGTVKNLTVEGSVTGAQNVGGIAGHSFGNIEKCHNAASIKGSSYTGGIVGYMESVASVQNCSNTGTVNAGSSRGGIVGYVTGTIKNCYNAGEVTGTSSNAGGIAGFLAGNSTVENCYNVGKITGTYSTGGVVGNSQGTVQSCYNYGAVIGSGGPVRGTTNGLCSNCFYLDTWVKGGRGAESKSAEQFASGEVAYLLQGGQEEQVWGQTVGTDYPELTGESSKKVYKITGVVEDQESIVWYSNSTATLPAAPVKAGFTFAGWSTEQGGSVNFDKDSTISKDMTVYAVWKVPFEGSGTEVDPYIIPDKATLEAFREYINAGNGKDKYFKLTHDINLAGSESEQWTPIGNDDYTFNGTFDGDGYTISGLYINNNETRQGLFGYIGERGTVKNLTVGGSVSCFMIGAGIVGMNYGGTVENCHNRCDVSSTSSSGNCGGVVGVNYSGTVTGCYNTGEIHGDVAGGITGVNNNITVTNCYNTGEIHGDDAGGITGLNYNSTIANCYNAGAVTGTDEYSQIGGIVGGENSGTVKDCYNVGEVSFDMDSEASAIGGIVGNKHDEATVANCYYLDTVTSGVGYGDSTGTTVKTETEFASGEVAWLLQDEQDTQVWGQTVGGYPELTDESSKKVYQITGVVDDQESVVWYSNNKATLPAAPVKSGFAFVGWSTTVEGTEADFEQGTTISADMTVYAVFKQLQPGEGSVTMADYTCGDDSVNPVAESETNGGEAVITYKQKGADDATYTSDKPTTVGEYTVRAVFAATDDYNEVTATANFKITHDYPDNWDGSSFECSCNRDLRLDVSYLTEVPEGLKGIESLDTVDEIRRVLVEAVSTGANSAVYDIRLEVMDATGRWVEATDETFPAEGIHIVLPYPAGTDSGCTFTVVHMFASGSRAGETETPTVTNTAAGIAFTVTGLSPVCVGWTYPYPVYPGPAAPSTPHYGVTTPPATSGGGVSVSPKSAQPGTKVTVTVTPEIGHHLGVLTVTDSAGRAVEVTDNGDGTYTFTMPYGQVSVDAKFVKCGSLNFTDLSITAWYHGYTDYVLANGLMHGKGNNRFAPEGTVTRAEMVTTLWNLRGNPVVNYYMTYSDVDEESWYSEAVRWASSEGIAQGYGNGKFGPNDDITREQMAVMLYRYEQKYGSGGFTGAWMYLVPFDDLESISDWAFEAVAWCNMRGVIEGKSGNMFDPKGPARRSELAAVLTRYGTGE